MRVTLLAVIIAVLIPEIGVSTGDLTSEAGSSKAVLTVDPPTGVRRSNDFFLSESNMCGVVAATVICNEFGIQVDVDKVAGVLRPSSDGTSMLELEQFFRSHGLAAVSVEITMPELAGILYRNPDLTSVALVEPDHWVAVLGATRDGVSIYSYPQSLAVPLEQMKPFYQGTAILVGDASAVGRGLSGGSRLKTVIVISSALWLGLWSCFYVCQQVWRVSSRPPLFKGVD